MTTFVEEVTAVDSNIANQEDGKFVMPTNECEFQPPLPIDDERNRLGEPVFVWHTGSVWMHTNDKGIHVWYAWRDGAGRGVRSNTLEEAQAKIGARVPVGCADFHGTRLGRCIDKGAFGEVWCYKETGPIFKNGGYPIYYVWPKPVEGSDAAVIALQYHHLAEARSAAGCKLPASTIGEKTNIAPPKKAKKEK